MYCPTSSSGGRRQLYSHPISILQIKRPLLILMSSDLYYLLVSGAALERYLFFISAVIFVKLFD